MSSDICGNCGHFEPYSGGDRFTCLFAKHAGLSYGMQVRPDTRACDAFIPLMPSPNVEEVVRLKETIMQNDEESETIGLCSMGKKTLLLANILAIIIVSWLFYTCTQS